MGHDRANMASSLVDMYMATGIVDLENTGISKYIPNITVKILNCA